MWSMGGSEVGRSDPDEAPGSRQFDKPMPEPIEITRARAAGLPVRWGSGGRRGVEPGGLEWAGQSVCRVAGCPMLCQGLRCF
jgi:hypothetical protein